MENAEVTSFLEWIKDTEDFGLFIDELLAVTKFLEENRAGRAIIAMLQVRLKQAYAAAGLTPGGKEDMEKTKASLAAVLRPESLYDINHSNGVSFGRIMELENLLSRGFGLAEILEDNRESLLAAWERNGFEAIEPQEDRKGEGL